MQKKPLYYLYILQLIVLAPSVVYWLEQRDWSLEGAGALAYFPLLGLLAFSMMWLHLMVAFLRRKQPEMFDYSTYYRVTSNIVLALIILHPLLLMYKAADLDFSYVGYAGDAGKPFIAFGMIALATFLIYEVIDRMRGKPVFKNNWQYVVAMNRIGFILIFVHGLQLGQHLQSGWLKGVWIFFGVTTLLYFIDSYIHEIKRDSKNA